jgi:hypothetical protein
MGKKCAVVFTCAAVVLAAQESNARRFDESAFRRAIDAGWPPGPDRSAAAYFAVANDEVATPILVKALKPKLTGKKPTEFVWAGVDWITYNVNERSIDAVADLCSTSQVDCRWIVESLLGHAAARDREYEVAYKTIEKYPDLVKFVVPWVSETIG